MRLRCFIVDTDPEMRDRLETALREMPEVEMQSLHHFDDAETAVLSHSPNLLLLRFADSSRVGERVLKAVQIAGTEVPTIALFAEPDPERIRLLVRRWGILDILTDQANADRIQDALHKAIKQIGENCKSAVLSRGFCAFVGVTPSLKERKILSRSGIGLTQNCSLRLAIEYWRKNPNLQLAAVCFNIDETFTSWPDEMADTWEETDILPWQIGMFEAQHQYLEYWIDPIRDHLMPALIPTMIWSKEGTDTLKPVDPESQKQMLVRVGKFSRRGKLAETLRSLRITFRPEHSLSRSDRFDEFIQGLEKQMEEVGERYPQLTRLRTKANLKSLIPDLPEIRPRDRKRMAYVEKQRDE